MSETIYKIPVPSTAFLEGVKFSMDLGRKTSLSYSYEDENSEIYSVINEKLIFDGVESFKCTYYNACSLEMLKAYDKVVDLGKTDWLKEIKQNLSNSGENLDSLKHMRIYFDDGPCYEYICKNFEVLIS